MANTELELQMLDRLAPRGAHNEAAGPAKAMAGAAVAIAGNFNTIEWETMEAETEEVPLL
jgi:hypothetical protein